MEEFDNILNTLYKVLHNNGQINTLTLSKIAILLSLYELYNSEECFSDKESEVLGIINKILRELGCCYQIESKKKDAITVQPNSLSINQGHQGNILVTSNTKFTSELS